MFSKRYIFPDNAGNKHGSSGRDPDPPKPGLFTRPSVEREIEKEARDYKDAYDRAVANRIANSVAKLADDE